MSVRVDVELPDETAAVLQRDAEQRGIGFAQAVAEHMSETARRLQGAAVEDLIADLEVERNDAGVYVALGI